jgi:diguanylate cyclase (GGDEF)-like protein
VTDQFGDARLEELKLLSELDHRGGLTITLPEGPYRDMIAFLVYERFVTAFNLPWRDTSWRLLEAHLHECWVKGLSDVLTGQSVHLELTHKGRVRLSELKQALTTGRTRETFGILWEGRHLETDLQIAILDASEDLPLSLGYLDMNGLKQINDTIGHDAGDLALRAYFQAVSTVLADKGEAYRTGGDEVIAVLPSHKLEKATGRLQKVCRLVMGEKIEFAGHKLSPLSLSVGIVTTIDAKTKHIELRQRAEKAMYRAKKEPHGPEGLRPSAIAAEEDPVELVR